MVKVNNKDTRRRPGWCLYTYSPNVYIVNWRLKAAVSLSKYELMVDTKHLKC